MKTRLFGALVVSSWALGCGGFENGPLQTGSLRGTVANVNGTDPAWIWVDGVTSPVPLNVDGSFALEDLPVGEVKLMVIANANEAISLQTVVQPATETSVPVTPALGGWFIVDLRDSGDPIPGANASVIGAPAFLQNVGPGSEGGARLGPLPFGCYTIHVKSSESAPILVEACVDSAALPVSVDPEFEDH